MNASSHIRTVRLKSLGGWVPNMTYSIIYRSCNKLLIGKTYWKSIVLPSLLFASAVIVWNKSELEQLQRVENKVWRTILGAPGYAPIVSLRGDLGASCMLARDMKTKLKYVKYAMSSSNELLKGTMLDMFRKGKGRYVKVVTKYLNSLGMLGLQDLDEIPESELLKKIDVQDERNWYEELSQKSTLELYREYKNEIKEEEIYENDFESCLLFRARSNTLKLNWRKRFEGGSTECDLCSRQEEESLAHFFECTAYQTIKQEHEMSEKTVQQILLFIPGVGPERARKYIGALWKERNCRMRD